MASSSAAGRRSPPYERPDMRDLRIVLLGKNVSENCRVGNTILGTAAFHSEASSHSQQHSVRLSGQVEKRRISVINTHLLQPHLSHHQITQRVRECVSLSAPGPHVIALVLQYNDFSEQDRHRVKHVLNLFSVKAIKHTIVVTTDELTRSFMIYKNINNAIDNLIKQCGGRHLQFDERNTGWRSEMFRRTEEILKKEHEQFLICYMYEDEDYGRSVDEDPSRNTHTSYMDAPKFPEGEKLNLVVCGSDRRLKSFTLNLILNQSVRGSELSSECVRRDVDLHGRLISLVELPALFNTRLSEEEVMRQTLRCVSLCDPGVHVFLLIIPDAPLNNEDRAEMEKIQKIFSSRINKHIMILMYQNPDHQTEELNEETQSVIESFGGHHSIGPNTQASELMEKLKQMVEDNSGVCFSTETLMEAQMEKLQTLEEMKRRIHSLETWFQSKDSREKEDDLRIVLLGKNGVGKSSTGNTILGREAFTAESSCESVTAECQRESAEIDGRCVTVIDTPGLFNTELTIEEILREIRHCISMILPGPHVLLLLITVGRFTQEEENSVKIIQEVFGEKSLMFTIVLFTRGDNLKNKTIDQWFRKPGSALMNLIEACGNRFHVFNNNQTGDRTQVSDLLKKIDDMVKENGGSYYSCKMFREMEREIQEQQMMIQMEKVEELKREKEELMNKHKEEKKKMKMKMEEERQNHDKERKRREEEFREREERYKREIKEREEQERKIREELKREREEWKREKQEAIQRRDEENERRKKIDQAMWDEYYQKLKQEIERRHTEREDLQSKHEAEMKRVKRKMEEERQNRDEERNRREEEFREREERYKTEMKREREEWEKQKQEEQQRREEEDERRRKKEQEMRDEYYQRLKQQRERMKMKMEEERKRREEEYIEREEQYRRDIKYIEDQEREMREEMKRERQKEEKSIQKPQSPEHKLQV